MCVATRKYNTPVIYEPWHAGPTNMCAGRSTRQLMLQLDKRHNSSVETLRIHDKYVILNHVYSLASPNKRSLGTHASLDVSFHCQKSLKRFDKSSADKNQSIKDKGIKMSPPPICAKKG